jgi:2-keto-4-pentenoate hydratase
MDVAASARELLSMRREQRVVDDLPAARRPSTLDEAYAVQDHLVGLLDDAPPIGYKCASTSLAGQRALGLDAPLFGRLLSVSTYASGGDDVPVLDASAFVHRVIEAEFGFRMEDDVEPVEGGHTAETIAEFVDAVIPSIEIVDHRFESWALGAPQIVADNAIHGAWIHGAPQRDWRHLDLAASPTVVRRNGETVASGSGANVLGHPLTVLAWLADELPRHGRVLRRGDLVTTGITTEIVVAAAGDTIEAHFDGVGSVVVRFR